MTPAMRVQAGRRPAPGPPDRRPPGHPVGRPRTQLLRMAAGFVRLFLEVECGKRHPRQLAALVDEQLLWRLEQVALRAGPPGKLLRIGGMHTAPQRFDAVAVVRRGPRTGAVAVSLRRQRGRWWVDDIARPEHGPLPPAPYPPLPEDDRDDPDDLSHGAACWPSTAVGGSLVG